MPARVAGGARGSPSGKRWRSASLAVRWSSAFAGVSRTVKSISFPRVVGRFVQSSTSSGTRRWRASVRILDSGKRSSSSGHVAFAFADSIFWWFFSRLHGKVWNTPRVCFPVMIRTRPGLCPRRYHCHLDFDLAILSLKNCMNENLFLPFPFSSSQVQKYKYFNNTYTHIYTGCKCFEQCRDLI